MEYLTEIQRLDQVLQLVEAVKNPEGLKAKIEELTAQASEPNLWDEPEKAQEITSKLSRVHVLKTFKH